MSEWEGATWHAMWTVAVEEERQRAIRRSAEAGTTNVETTEGSWFGRWRSRRRSRSATATTPRTPER